MDRWVSLRSTHPTLIETTKEKEGSGTPTDADLTVRTSGCGARHGWIGLRRPSAAGALACRRSTDGVFLEMSEHLRPAHRRAKRRRSSNGYAMLPGTRPLAHDPEKWKPVFRSDHAPLKSGTARWALPIPTCPSPVAPTAGHELPAADAQSRPGAVRNAARGHRTRSGRQVYLPAASFMSEI
jgi:hypothetical protein